MRLVRKVLFFDRMSVLTGCCHAQIEVFHHWVSSGHPKNGHGSPTGQRLFATKLALLGRRRALRETPFLHVRVQSPASDGAAPGSSWPWPVTRHPGASGEPSGSRWRGCAVTCRGHKGPRGGCRQGVAVQVLKKQKKATDSSSGTNDPGDGFQIISGVTVQLKNDMRKGFLSK